MNRAMIRPVILAGGSGSRLWPMSTPSAPKHLIPLIGETTLLEQALDRVAHREIFKTPVVVCAASQAEAISDIAPSSLLIVEPMPRNSGPAIALAAMTGDPDDLLLILPSDHYVANPEALLAAVEQARELAEKGWLITFGITPTRPETGYGYIAAGEMLSAGVHKAARFVEKPDASTAKQLILDDRNLWNAGIFLMKASTLVTELRSLAPDMLKTVGEAVSAGRWDGTRFDPEPAAFAAAPAISIDYAVMERTSALAVVPVALEWCDLGSWAALHDISEKDSAGNSADAGAMMIDSSDCLVRSSGPRVVTIGVSRIAVIATGDNVLVVSLDSAQKVREAAEQLSSKD